MLKEGVFGITHANICFPEHQLSLSYMLKEFKERTLKTTKKEERERFILKKTIFRKIQTALGILTKVTMNCPKLIWKMTKFNISKYEKWSFLVAGLKERKKKTTTTQNSTKLKTIVIQKVDQWLPMAGAVRDED